MIVIELTDMKFTNTDLKYKDILFYGFLSWIASS